jgi:hypothetical protein
LVTGGARESLQHLELVALQLIRDSFTRRHHPDMEAAFSWRYMEPVLEWVLFLAVLASGLCMLALALMIFVGRYRARRQHKSREAVKQSAEI